MNRRRGCSSQGSFAHLQAQLETMSRLESAVHEIRRCWPIAPRVGIVLGTGLGQYVNQIQCAVEIDFDRVPHLPPATAMGHRGRFVCGTIRDVPVIAMDGRFHPYEGYSMNQLTFPIRMMIRLGIEQLVLSNASGGIHPRLRQGDILIIQDHINLMWSHPWVGLEDADLHDGCEVPRFPEMPSGYDAHLISQAKRIARKKGVSVQVGVYAAVTGPNYETRAEYRFLRTLGADVVGMSTVPEVLVAHHAGLPVLALSAITNVCRPDCTTSTEGHAVIEAARSTEPKMRDIVTGVISETTE